MCRSNSGPARHDGEMSWDLDVEEARELVEELLQAMPPPDEDVWVVTHVQEREWGWIVSWSNRRAAEGSRESHDLYAGGGPYLVARKTARVAMAGSAHPVDHYVELWLRGEWPDQPRPS